MRHLSTEPRDRVAVVLRWWAFGLPPAALAAYVAEVAHGHPVAWRSWGVAVLVAGNGAVLLGAGRDRPRAVRAYWIASTAVATAVVLAVFTHA